MFSITTAASRMGPTTNYRDEIIEYPSHSEADLIEKYGLDSTPDLFFAEDGTLLDPILFSTDNSSPSYSLMTRAILYGGPAKVERILRDYPRLLHQVTTGGATLLHICSQTQLGQLSTPLCFCMDTIYKQFQGYTALHYMAKQNLALGGMALVPHMDPKAKTENISKTPIEVAVQNNSVDFLMAMQNLGHYR